jgi:hypothetical protein
VHTELEQSPGTVQAWPGVHRLQDVEPPQSTPLSPPFWIPSLQVGAWQATLHERLAQSEPRTQCCPGMQPAHVPPQSTSVSEPFNVMSMHDGVAHMLLRQTPLEQSAAMPQMPPTAQAGHVPPQSTSVSEPLRTPSLHSAG